jgi:hypothetical protein
MRTLEDELNARFADDEFCRGVIQESVRVWCEEDHDEQTLLNWFQHAAKARKTDLNGIIALMESRPQQGIRPIAGWEDAKAVVVKAKQ